ncbi:MAG: efflux RND transporter periplasmic adaptor subunit, partial [Candidatus Brocadiaceae bacterium]
MAPERRRGWLARVLLTAVATAGLAAGALAVEEKPPRPPTGERALACRARVGDFVRSVRARGTLRAARVTLITAQLSDHYVVELVPRGASVAAGDVIARLDTEGIEEEILNTRGEIVAARSALAAAEAAFERTKLEVGTGIEELEAQLAVARAKLQYEQARPLPEEERIAEAMLKRAEARLEYARYWRELTRLLFEEDLASQQDVRRAEFDHHTARIELARAEKAHEETLKGASREDLEEAEVEVDELRVELQEARETREQRTNKARAKVEEAQNTLDKLQTTLSELEEDLEKATVRAEHDGAVFSHGESTVQVGDPVWKGKAIADLADTSALVLSCKVRECDSQLVEEGQAARVHLLSMPGRPIEGEVVSVAGTLSEDDANPDMRHR